MINCIYCQKEIDPSSAIVTEVGTACSDCAVKPETQQESQNQAQEPQETPFNLLRSFRELQWVRLKQWDAGETDSVIMKRSLSEIILMMEKEIQIAKSAVTELHTEASLNARFHTLAAVCYGLAYLSTHPGPG